jgi:hypothetical protein
MDVQSTAAITNDSPDWTPTQSMAVLRNADGQGLTRLDTHLICAAVDGCPNDRHRLDTHTLEDVQSTAAIRRH